MTKVMEGVVLVVVMDTQLQGDIGEKGGGRGEEEEEEPCSPLGCLIIKKKTKLDTKLPMWQSGSLPLANAGRIVGERHLPATS